jgi:hypothetical protein
MAEHNESEFKEAMGHAAAIAMLTTYQRNEMWVFEWLRKASGYSITHDSTTLLFTLRFRAMRGNSQCEITIESHQLKTLIARAMGIERALAEAPN